MAMDEKKLSNDIISALSGVQDKNDQASLWQAVARAIISHIKENAEVSPGIPVETAGSAAAQTGTTTGAGKII